MRCVVIDDSAYIRMVVKGTLEDLEVEVLLAEDAVEGFALCERSVPDLIFVDYHLPGMDGLEFVEKFRRKFGTAAKIILATAGADINNFNIIAYRTGADIFLFKPFGEYAIEGALKDLQLI